jgi:hypothetical protein
MSPAAVGIADHCGWGWFVAIGWEDGGPVLLDSRRRELLAPGLPRMAFHHDTVKMELAAARQLIATVRASALEYAQDALVSLQDELGPDHPLVALAIRHPTLPYLPDVEETQRNPHVNNRADGVLFHRAICAAAEASGIAVSLHARGEEEDLAAQALHLSPAKVKALVEQLGESATNWTKEHRHAAAAAIAALRRHAAHDKS